MSARSYIQTSYAITSAASTVAVENRMRQAIILFNTGSTAVKIGIGTALIEINAKDHLAFLDEDAPLNELVAQTASGTSTLVVWEA